MKKLFAVLIFLLIFIGVEITQAGTVFLTGANRPTVIMLSSGAKVTSGRLSLNKCAFHGILISTNGTNDAVVNLYDNTAASGKKIIPQITVTGADNYGGLFVGPVGIYVTKDIYLSISGTGASAVIYYDDGRSR